MTREDWMLLAEIVALIAFWIGVGVLIGFSRAAC